MNRSPGRPRIGLKIEVRLAPETVIRLDHEAQREHIFRAELVRRIIEEYLATNITTIKDTP